MALGDFKFNPENGWNDTNGFPNYPARDQVRPLMQKLFDQIKTWLNGDLKTFVNGIDTDLTTHKAETAKVFISVTNPPAPLVAAVGDGVTDDKAAIQAVIDHIHTQYGGGVVIFPYTANYYKVSGKLTLHSNISLVGSGGKAYIYNDTASAEPVIEIVGTSANRLKNVGLKNLKIRNGTASEANYTAYKDGVEVQYCDGFKMRACEITEIQGAFGLSTRYSTDIYVKDGCKFYRCTYSCFSVLPECENVHVEGNTFDTCTSLTTPNTYLFATGGDATIDDYFCKNVWVKDNKFINNPRWEGIDTHGCENIWIEDNYIINVNVGIMAGLALGYVANPVHKNININNNVIIQGTGVDNGYAIVVIGGVDDTHYILADHVKIKGNKTNGFGAITNATSGAITTYITDNLTIEDNVVEEFRGIGIVLYYGNYNAFVSKNRIKNAIAKVTSGSASYGIRVASDGNMYVKIEDNKVWYDDNAKAIDDGIAVGTLYNHIQALNNKLLVSRYEYTSNFINTEKASTPTAIFGTRGDVATDTNDVVKYACTDPMLRFDSTKASGLLVDGTATSNELTITAATEAYYSRVVAGLEIVVVGAGIAGANLTTMIIRVSNKKIWLKDNVITSVTGAALNYTSATWVVS